MMAQIPCDLCASEEAIMMQTALANGDTVGVGANCIVGFYLGCLGELTAGMPVEVAETFSDATAIVVQNLAPSLMDLARTANGKAGRGKRAPTSQASRADSADKHETPQSPSVPAANTAPSESA